MNCGGVHVCHYSSHGNMVLPSQRDVWLVFPIDDTILGSECRRGNMSNQSQGTNHQHQLGKRDYVCTPLSLLMYIQRERERERERKTHSGVATGGALRGNLGSPFHSFLDPAIKYQHNEYSDACISGMERAMITILVSPGSYSQMLITYQIQSHCVKQRRS